MQAVADTKSFLSWVGGKSLLADRIIALAPPHKCYCEVFAGAAWVLFKKPESKVEVLNDLNADLITLYRVVQHHLEEFIRYFRWTLVSRDEFNRLKKVSPDTLTDIQRAARFYYMVKSAFGSKVTHPSFGTSTTVGPRLNLLRIEEELSGAHLRLAKVIIENMHYEEFIASKDRPHTWFYIDPPYYGCESYYGVTFERADFQRLAAILPKIKGRFIMSINDRPEVRRLFAPFRCFSARTNYSLGGGRGVKLGELLFTNFEPPADAVRGLKTAG